MYNIFVKLSKIFTYILHKQNGRNNTYLNIFVYSKTNKNTTITEVILKFVKSTRVMCIIITPEKFYRWTS